MFNAFFPKSLGLGYLRIQLIVFYYINLKKSLIIPFSLFIRIILFLSWSLDLSAFIHLSVFLLRNNRHQPELHLFPECVSGREVESGIMWSFGVGPVAIIVVQSVGHQALLGLERRMKHRSWPQ